MNNWTPSTIYQKAAAIADLAKQIDAQLWYSHRYNIIQSEAYNRDLEEKARELQLKIAEFRALDLEVIVAELRDALK